MFVFWVKQSKMSRSENMGVFYVSVWLERQANWIGGSVYWVASIDTCTEVSLH